MLFIINKYISNDKLCIVVIDRMDDKGEVKCIKFSLGNKILAVQRTTKSVVSIIDGCCRNKCSCCAQLINLYIF